MRSLLPAALAVGCIGAVGASAGPARTDAATSKQSCLAAHVHGNKVHAGPFTGQVNPGYVVNGRFRLYDLPHQAGSTRLSNKMGWFLPRKRAREAPSLSVKGVRLVPPGRAFTDQLAEIFYSGKPENQHVYASNFKLPTAGCWRLTFKTGRVKGSVVVLVRNG
jgi:hypothetical protein